MVSSKLDTSSFVAVTPRDDPENTSIDNAESTVSCSVVTSTDFEALSSSSAVVIVAISPADTASVESASIDMPSDEIELDPATRRSKSPSALMAASLVLSVKTSATDTVASSLAANTIVSTDADSIESTYKSMSWLRLVIVPPVDTSSDVTLETLIASPTSTVAPPPIRMLLSIATSTAIAPAVSSMAPAADAAIVPAASIVTSDEDSSVEATTSSLTSCPTTPRSLPTSA